MQISIPKFCADSLRTFSEEKYNVKLKAAHAHELAAAYMGYKSKIALVADKKYPVSNLPQSAIVVMMPDAFIDQRRKNLTGLPSELPDSYTLGEAVYSALFDDKWWSSDYPPFRSFQGLAEHFVLNNDGYQTALLVTNLPVQLVVVPEYSENQVSLTVFVTTENSEGERMVHGKATIILPRAAGHIGYGPPKATIERWSSEARRTLKSLGVEL